MESAGTICAFLLVMCCLWRRICTARRLWARNDDAGAGERAAHTTNFAWAFYTLAAPLALDQLLQLAVTMNADTDPFLMQDWNEAALEEELTVQFASFSNLFTFIIGILIFFCCIWIPRHAVRTMILARGTAVLRSRAFEARYGWLTARYPAPHTHMLSDAVLC